MNCGSSEEIYIGALAKLVARVIGYDGKITFDDTKPDGTPRKMINLSGIVALGWTTTISLQEGVAQSYRWFFERVQAARLAA